MTIGEARQWHRKLPATVGKRLTVPVNLSQWVVAGAVGVVLGVCALVISVLPRQWAPFFLLSVLFPFIALIVGNVRRLLLAVILLEIPIQIDIYFSYRYAEAELNALGGLNVSLTTLCLAGLYAMWLAESLAGDAKSTRTYIRSNIPVGFYLLLVALSVVEAHDVQLAIFEVVLLAQAFLLFIYMIHTVRTREDLLFVVTLLMVGLALQGMIMIGLRGLGRSVEVGPIFARIDDNMRVGGTVGSPNTVGSYLTLMLAPALGLLVTSVPRFYKILAGAAFSLGCVGMLLTFSRGSWAGFSISLMLFCLFAWYRGWLSSKILFALLGFFTLVALVFQDLIFLRLFGDDGGAAYARIPLMQIAIQMIRDNPLLGVGANNFAVSLAPYVTPDFSYEWISTVHNKYLLVWAETGTAAFFAFLAFLATTVYRGWRVARRGSRFLSPIALGFTVAIVGNMTQMMVDLFHGRPQVQMLWLVAGLIAAVDQVQETENTRQ